MLARAILIGRVGNKEVRAMANGTGSLTRISLATNKKSRNKATGEMDERTSWHNISFFNKLSEVAGQYVNVGDMIYVDGEISHQKVKTGNGEEKYMYSITAHTLRMLNSKQESKKEPVEINGNAKEVAFEDSAIPF